jgi:hypothetical protein
MSGWSWIKDSDVSDVVEVVLLHEVLEPDRAGSDSDRVAVEIGEVVDGGVGVDHDGLGVSLHGGSDGYEWKPLGDGDEDSVGGGHGEVGTTAGDELVADHERPAGSDGDVQTLLLVVALEEGGVKAAVLGLRVPVGLEGDVEESVRRCWLFTGREKEENSGAEQDE